MTDPKYVLLEDRGLIGIAGEDKRTFLQGLVSNDVRKVTAKQAIYAAFLTPQGKYLHDLFIVDWRDMLLLDCEAGRLADLKRRLGIYKLRADVVIVDQTKPFVVAAFIGDGVCKMVGLAPSAAGAAQPFTNGIAYVDPRLPDAGVRAILPRESARKSIEAAGFVAGSRTDYDRLRIRLGLPDGSHDMQIEKAILLENGFDELNGVDWDKGCFMGQELTARTKYRGLIKKRLIPVSVDGRLPEPGTPVILEGEEAGEIRSGTDGWALALIRLEFLNRAAASGKEFSAGTARITPAKPDWAVF
jgi:hypothetical protein